MEEYEYLENLNSEELAKIIDQMLDFEETTKALMILEEKDSQKALELGKDIIKNNKGDDYLQATVLCTSSRSAVFPRKNPTAYCSEEIVSSKI